MSLNMMTMMFHRSIFWANG